MFKYFHLSPPPPPPPPPKKRKKKKKGCSNNSHFACSFVQTRIWYDTIYHSTVTGNTQTLIWYDNICHSVSLAVPRHWSGMTRYATVLSLVVPSHWSGMTPYACHWQYTNTNLAQDKPQHRNTHTHTHYQQTATAEIVWLKLTIIRHCPLVFISVTASMLQSRICGCNQCYHLHAAEKLRLEMILVT